MGFVQFMSSTAGRWARGIAGVALIALGVALGGDWWIGRRRPQDTLNGLTPVEYETTMNTTKALAA
jgi:hypothetical protein